MTMIDTVRDMQTRYIDGVKTAQEQIVSYNERIADSVSGAVPEWQAPFSEYLPKPAELVDSYYTYLGELYEANKEFATRIVSAWERSEDADA